MIGVMFNDNYSTGYGIAGTNIKNIVCSRYKVAPNVSNCNVNIFIKIPPLQINPSRYNIGYFYWETIDFPKSWIPYILKLDEFWSPCDLVTKNLIKIGFSGKILSVPTPIIENYCDKNFGLGSNKDGFYNKKFMFYSIFDWNYRKGYDVLFESYFSEFSSENVGLFVKTMARNRQEDRAIIDEIKKIKMSVPGEKPSVFVSTDRLDYDHILAIHKKMDCFVLPHRGEGWGIPIHEAMAHYNPIITTKFGGITDYLSEKSAYLIDYSMTEVKNMGRWNDLYSDKMWAEPSKKSLMANMRTAFLDSEDFYKKRLMSRHVYNSLRYENVSGIIIRRLENIHENFGLV